jgi:hypothetical protein
LFPIRTLICGSAASAALDVFASADAGTNIPNVPNINVVINNFFMT